MYTGISHSKSLTVAKDLFKDIHIYIYIYIYIIYTIYIYVMYIYIVNECAKLSASHCVPT